MAGSEVFTVHDWDPARLIVHVVPYFPPHLGGVEEVARALSSRQAEHRPVLVVTSNIGAARLPSVTVVGNLVVRRLRAIEVAHIPFMPRLGPVLARLPRAALVHVHISQAYVQDLVWLTSKLRRRRYVAHFHLDVQPSGRFGPVFSLYKRTLLGVVLRAASDVIALTSQQGELLQTEYGVKAERISIIPNGVADEFFTRSPRQRSAPVSGSEPLRLLFVGRLAPQKRVDRLLDALGSVRAPVELVVVGDGAEHPLLEQRRAGLGLANVKFVGLERGDELLSYYRWADVFVLPSDIEGMPLAVLEAMAIGLPVVAADASGVEGLVGDGGLIVAPTALAFAAAIDRLADDEDFRRQLSRNASNRAKRYSTARLSADVERVYPRSSD